jgi:catechol 2,3-dioxygenase-like lactoylglutathione lyase family enzyme
MAVAGGAAAALGPVRRLRRLSLTCADAGQLARFYQRAFGCRALQDERRDGAQFEQLMGVNAGARCVLLALGGESVELLQFDRGGEPYPLPSAASDLLFQHFAIVVTDMRRAYGRLCELSGWSAISQGGPQRLPAASGGVTAYKFRDPEGHPLELLEFAPTAVPPRWRAAPAGEPCVGIDHSAICVADSVRSVAFYEALGLRRVAYTLNSGPAQQRLDGVAAPSVEVTALAPQEPGPHVELLCYRGGSRGTGSALHSNDIAATRLVFERSAGGPEAAAAPPRRMLDLDHHQLVIE